MTTLEQQVIQRCKKSAVWFIRTFAKVKHPSAGIIAFNPFKYQVHAIKSFRQHRFHIFRKTRQAGISKLCGIFALWYAMFFSNKKILIVSRTDSDAMNFLKDNIKFPFDNLPAWMKVLWTPEKNNDHEISFPNGSTIRSLTSHPDVLRSNASSLNIIDEAAFIQGMGVMWSSGWSTLQHGGSCIVISTTNGVGDWYWATCMDAESGNSPFKQLMVNWWDMDWHITYKDALTGNTTRIAPTDGIRECTTQEDIERYGPYWSPWLEQQYLGLQEKGEEWKFKQEVLAEFVGSGNTVLPPSSLAYIGAHLSEDFKRIDRTQTYVHPVTNERRDIDFTVQRPEEGMWIWKEPDKGRKIRRQGELILDQGTLPHCYVAGVDLSTGKSRDYHAVEIFDVDTREQVAEMMVRCLPRDFKYILDYIGRWYNNALLVIERNNGGDSFIDEMRLELMYPRIWRKTEIKDNGISMAHHGYYTSSASKPVLNKVLINYLRNHEEEGFKVNSVRLFKQLQTYVRKKDKMGRDTSKTEAEDGSGNFDDLVMAAALALVGMPDAGLVDFRSLTPMRITDGPNMVPNISDVAVQKQWMEKGGPELSMPMLNVSETTDYEIVQDELSKFVTQMISNTAGPGQSFPVVISRKHSL